MNYSLPKYISSLRDGITQSEVLRNLDFDLGEIEKYVIPMFECASSTSLSGTTLTSTSSQFLKAFDTKRKDKGMYDELYDTFSMLLENKEALLHLVKEEIGKENPKAIMDYFKINLLKYIESIHFLSNYATQWLSVVTVETLGESEYLKLPDIKVSRGFVLENDNIVQAGMICKVLNQPLHEFVSSITPLKGHQFTEYDWEQKGEETEKKVDKFKSGFIPVRWNPLYHIGVMVATWCVEQDAKKKHEFERLQYILMELKDRESGTTDAESKKRLQKQITYYSNQVNLKQVQLEKIEDRYGV